MGYDDAIKELYARRAKAKLQGGEEKVKQQHARGRLTARERVDKLADTGTFWEMGMLNTSNQPGMEEVSAADGRVCGMALINGRKTAIVAQDNTILGGSGGRVGHKKLRQLVRMATDEGYPVVKLMDGVGGVRLPEQMGSRGMCEDKNIGSGAPDPHRHYRTTPWATAILGECFGEPSWAATQSDFSVMVKGTAMGAAGPRIVGKAIAQKITPQELCGWELHANVTGQVSAFANNDDEAIALIKDFLSYMPLHNGEEPPYLDTGDDPYRKLELESVKKIVSDQLNRGYDMYRLIKLIVDNGKYLPFKAEWGKAVVTCLARIGGKVVGIIGNNPMYNAGAPDGPACEKETNFVCICDSFNIPIVFLQDVPGMYPGADAEKQKIPTRIMVTLQAIGLASVPKIGVLLRKAYGIGWRVMGVTHDDMSAAWPIASISFVDPDIGIELVHGRRLAAIADPKQRELERQQLREQWAIDCTPWGAAQTTPLEVIDPSETRKWIYQSLNILRGRKGTIGKHELANWPTNF